MKTDIAFITLKLCKLHKRDASYLCVFADVIYISMRIEIEKCCTSNTKIFDVIYISMRIEILEPYLEKNGKRRCKLSINNY